MQSLAERLDAYMIKAVREGKERSRAGATPTPTTRQRLQRFVRGVLDASRPNPFLVDFHAFVTSLARLGAISSLSQLVLKADRAGGAGHLSGRRVVGFQPRRSGQSPAGRLGDQALAACGNGSRAAGRPRKQIGRMGARSCSPRARLLALRRAHPQLFSAGDYQPLEVVGERSQHLCAFARNYGGLSLVVAVPRLVYQLHRGRRDRRLERCRNQAPAQRCVAGCLYPAPA